MGRSRVGSKAYRKTRLKAIVNYAYDTYGRFPVNYDTTMVPIAVQAYHPDMEFYEKYISLPLPEAIRDHMKSWHV